MDVLKDLNSAQREAVLHLQGPVLVIAGPGSGKTRVIAHRIAYLVKEVGISPRRIMAVTFTNKAAREMKERVEGLIGKADDLTIGTFHAICARILRTYGEKIGIDRHFVIYDDEDSLTALKQALSELNIDEKNFPPKRIKEKISAMKARLRTYEEMEVESYFDDVVKRVYERYEDILMRSKALDFDDLIMKTVFLLRSREDVLSSLQERYLHLLIDEFQDTNLSQYVLSKLIAGKYKNLFAVGDPDQSIYSWRFADLRHILDFPKDFDGTKVVFLEQNYRSTRKILSAANKLISANKTRMEKNLWTQNEDGYPITIIKAHSEFEEAHLIAMEIEKLLSEGFSFRDIAVMYRINARSRPFEEAFIRLGIPYKLVGGIRFYERKEIKDIIAYLRVVQNRADDTSLMRVINVPPRGIGEKTIKEIRERALSSRKSLFDTIKDVIKEGGIQRKRLLALKDFVELIEGLGGRPSEIIDEVVKRTGYYEYINDDERIENIIELRKASEEYEDLPSFLESITLLTDIDRYDPEADAVTLITLHQSKGLEFPVVFIAGMEEGVLPHYKSMEDEEVEEERRLCYVGITRAMKRVYLSFSMRGSYGYAMPSRFLMDIPAEACEPLPSKPKIELIKVGDRVRHRVFGEGVVLSLSQSGDDMEVMVAFDDGSVKRLLQSYAKLEKI